jgi:hypothetical protein
MAQGYISLSDEPEPEAAVSAWTEEESAREEASLAWEHVASLAEEVQQRRLELGQVVCRRDQPRSQAAEAMSRADVLGGQLAEATEQPFEVSARAGTLTETLAMMARAWCWPPPSRWRSFRPRRRPRPGQIAPKVVSEPAGRVCLECVYLFRGRRGPNIPLSCCKAAFPFLLFRVSGLVHR